MLYIWWISITQWQDWNNIFQFSFELDKFIDKFWKFIITLLENNIIQLRKKQMKARVFYFYVVCLIF